MFSIFLVNNYSKYSLNLKVKTYLFRTLKYINVKYIHTLPILCIDIKIVTTY